MHRLRQSSEPGPPGGAEDGNLLDVHAAGSWGSEAVEWHDAREPTGVQEPSQSFSSFEGRGGTSTEVHASAGALPSAYGRGQTGHASIRKDCGGRGRSQPASSYCPAPPPPPATGLRGWTHSPASQGAGQEGTRPLFSHAPFLRSWDPPGTHTTPEGQIESAGARK